MASSSQTTTLEENLIVIDPDGDLIVDIAQSDEEEWDTKEDDEWDGFDERIITDATKTIWGLSINTKTKVARIPSRQEAFDDSAEQLTGDGNENTGDPDENQDGDGNENPGDPNENHERDGNEHPEEDPGADPKPPEKKNRGQFPSIFQMLNPGWQRRRTEARCSWGVKAFKILMHIAHLQFVEIPDKPGINTMVKLVMAADYLVMIPILNPWVLRWGFETPRILYHYNQFWGGNHEYCMKLLYISLQLGYTSVFRACFNKLVEHTGDTRHPFKRVGLPIPQTLLESLETHKERRIGYIIDSLHEIIDIYVNAPEDETYSEGRWCTTRCKSLGWSHLMMHLHRINIYPNLPERPYKQELHCDLIGLISSGLKDFEIEGCRNERENAPVCTLRWALDILYELPPVDNNRLEDFLTGWENRKLKTWTMYRNGRARREAADIT